MKPKKLPFLFNVKNKRSFILIEILIALLIITLFTIPLIRNPIYFCKSQIKSLEKLECERIAELTFLDLKIDLLKKEEININKIPKYEEEAPKIPLKSYPLKLLKKKKIKRFYKLYSKRQKRSLNDDIYKLVHVKIYLQPEGLKEEEYLYKYKMVVKV